jgi:voltage-gated potassium channel
MTTPLARVRRGLIILGLIFMLSVSGYVWAGYPWLEAVWMVVITIASVGFGERSTQAPAVQLLTIAVVLFGLTAAAYTFGGLLQLLLAGELEQILGKTRMTRDINHITDHIIVVGYGRIGRILSASLHRKQRPFVIVEGDAERCREAHDRGYLYVNGDATDDEVLLRAGVARARTLVSALPNDANNVFITLTSRNLNSKLKIIARAEHSTSERKLRQAGADQIVMPSTIGAQQMGRMITRPHTADLLERLAESGTLSFEADEIEIPQQHSLVGKTLRESGAPTDFEVLILAGKHASGEISLGTDPNCRLAPRDVLLIVAERSKVAAFRAHHRL